LNYIKRLGVFAEEPGGFKVFIG